MQQKKTRKIIIDTTKLETLLRIGCPESVISDYIFHGKLKKQKDDLVNLLLESLLDRKEFSNWGGSRNPYGCKGKNQNDNQVDYQDENHLDCQVVDKDKDILCVNNNINNNININNNNIINNKYIYSGDIIKLNQKDFEKWKNKFSNINLLVELDKRDIWLSESKKNGKNIDNWFLSTMQYFAKLNREKEPVNRFESWGEIKMIEPQKKDVLKLKGGDLENWIDEVVGDKQ